MIVFVIIFFIILLILNYYNSKPQNLEETVVEVEVEDEDEDEVEDEVEDEETTCDDGYTLKDNECILDKTFIEYEHFIGGAKPNLENSNTFAIFLSDFAGYDSETAKLGDNIETFSNIFDDTFFAHYFIDGETGILKLSAPMQNAMVNKYSPSGGESVNPGLKSRNIRATYNYFKVEPAEIAGHDDIYYIKTDNPTREHNGEVVYRSNDSNRPADKYIGFQNDRFEYVDTIDDASLFRQKTREADLTLPEDVELPEEVDTKTYFVRVEEDITEGDE